MQRLDTLELHSFIEYKNELLELINVDCLDEVATVFNHKTKTHKTIGLFEYVIPIDVKIQKIAPGDTLSVCRYNNDASFWLNAADNLIRAAPMLEAAAETLKLLGYTYHGGVLWRPPVRKNEGNI